MPFCFFGFPRAPATPQAQCFSAFHDFPARSPLATPLAEPSPRDPQIGASGLGRPRRREGTNRTQFITFDSFSGVSSTPPMLLASRGSLRGAPGCQTGLRNTHRHDAPTTGVLKCRQAPCLKGVPRTYVPVVSKSMSPTRVGSKGTKKRTTSHAILLFWLSEGSRDPTGIVFQRFS